MLPFCTCGWTRPRGCSSCVEAAAFAVVGVPCGAEKVKCELTVFAGQRNFSSPGSGRGRTDRRSAGRPVPSSPGHRTCRSQLVTSYRLWIIVVGGNLISNPQSSRDAWWPVDHGRGRTELVINIINRCGHSSKAPLNRKPLKFHRFKSFMDDLRINRRIVVCT